MLSSTATMPALISIALLTLALGTQRPTPDTTLDALAKVVSYQSLAISPDGSTVAFGRALPTPDGPSPTQSELMVVDRTGKGAARRRVTATRNGAFVEESAPTFSPDGKRLAFLSDADKPGQPQLYVADLGTGAVRRLTQADGHLAAPTWSPDGKRLAVLFIEHGLSMAGPLGPSERPAGVIQETVREQRIATVPADGGALVQVSPPDLFVYEYAWSPDGRTFAVTAAPGSGDNNWWVATLMTVPTAGGPAHLVYRPPLQLASPTWSPDGRALAFIGGLMSDQGANGGDVFLVPAQGGPSRNVTPGQKPSASQLVWTKRGGLVEAANLEGKAAFLSVDPSGQSAPRLLWEGPENLHVGWNIGAVFAADGRTLAAFRETFTQAAEVVAGPLGHWTELTHLNASAPDYAGAVQSLTWTSRPFEVQGWLVLPKEGAGGRPPLVVIAHGGPGGAYFPSYEEDEQLLLSQGYAILLPNPRGSFGQGEAFTRANVKDFGYGDLRDIVAGVDAAAATGKVDGARVGITGHSYGGFLTMFAVTQSHRFAAAAASAGIANWQSYYGENGIDQWMLPFFGATVYDDPAAYARSSPMTFIKHVTTPTLLVVGERDAECPMPQSFEFWHALKALGVPTELVVYPDEGHHFRRPQDVHDRARRVIGWFDHYLKGTPGGGAPRP